MSELKKDSLMIAYDGEIGVIYYPAKGAVSSTTPRHAQAMEQVWQEYLEDKLSQEDRTAFESYIARSFANKPDLPVKKYTNLRETRVLGRLEILVANRCNLNCQYCYAHGGDYDCQSQVLTPDLAKKYLRALFTDRYTSVDIVMLFGGEPTVAPDTIRTICEFFEQYSSLGIIEKMPVFTMVTNGALIDEALTQTIQKYKIRNVTVADCKPNGYDDSLVSIPESFSTKEEIHDMPSSIMLLRRKLTQKAFCDMHCGSGVQAAALMPNGDLYPCHQFVGQSKYRIAQFVKDTFEFDNYSSLLSEFSAAHKCNNSRCTDCWAKVLCCACQASLLLPGKAASINDKACQFEKTRQTQLILALAKENAGKTLHQSF